MLSPEVTVYDWIFIVFMVLAMLCMYAGYRWGHADGYKQGCRDRRMAQRQMQMRRQLRQTYFWGRAHRNVGPSLFNYIFSG